MTDTAAKCYAVRRVNPFEGVLEVVEGGAARAYSGDGRVWQIQVRTQRPDDTWRSSGKAPPVEQFFNFGLWDAQDGLHRVVANPVLDIGGMSTAAEALIAVLEDVGAALPFALADDYECWATDDHGAPVALLATTEAPGYIDAIRVPRWQATRVGDHGFRSAALAAAGIPAEGAQGPRRHAEYLEVEVRGLGRHRAWFRRAADTAAERIDPEGTRHPVDVGLFPPLGLKTDWSDATTGDAVADYIDWLAPRLLLLPNLDDATRRRLERAACRRAVELTAVYRLLPQVLDHDAIEAARVEARLRQATV